ncbi:MAG: hypothetical protein H6830_11445 [Planctomycetes bacterium]|nr:hypothetical protein [Planctomycetota bacterium]MCB9908718.1 hypothetical protein [Planctomycetota bacterium]HPF14796.1 hypothetical protein [Planctomycetota bacterium]HRV82189.1 hypothetical protein [Planctomycetota bacterium]
MAQTRKKASSARRTGAAETPKASARAPRASVDVVEEEKGFGLEEGIVFFTTILLIVAFFMIDRARGSYGEGMFFK